MKRLPARAVFLTPEQIDRFYLGFSNEVIWPLFHDLQSFCRLILRTGTYTAK